MMTDYTIFIPANLYERVRRVAEQLAAGRQARLQQLMDGNTRGTVK